MNDKQVTHDALVESHEIVADPRISRDAIKNALKNTEEQIGGMPYKLGTVTPEKCPKCKELMVYDGWGADFDTTTGDHSNVMDYYTCPRCGEYMHKERRGRCK